MLLFHPIRLEGLPSAIPDLGWTLVWLIVGGLLFILVLLAFMYLLLRRREDLASQLLHQPAFSRADQWLSNHFPHPWAFLRQRFSVRQWHGLALTAAIIILFAAIYLFALITESWTEQEALYSFDQRIYHGLVTSLGGRTVAFMQIITRFGDGLTITLIGLALGGSLLLRCYWWKFVSLLLAVGGGAGLMWGLKWVFERSRPSDQLAQAAGHSFPSGHTFLATTLYGFAIYLVWRLVKHDAGRIGITLGLVILIFLVGLSRVILRVHWVSDVAGGFTIGLGWLVCSLVIGRVLQAYFSSTPLPASS